MLFNTQVTESRIQEVRIKLFEYLGAWRPKSTNRIALYKANGEKWLSSDSKDQVVQENKRFNDMPSKAIEYLRTLPEFDASIFQKITGINIFDCIKEQTSCANKIVTIEGKQYKLTEV